MTTLIFTLVAANLSLYFSFVSLTQSFQGMPGRACAALLLGPGACALGCLTAGKRQWLRFLFVWLPLLPLLPVTELRQTLLLAPAVLYPIFVLVIGRFSVFYWDYRNHILCTGGLLLVLLLFSQAKEVRTLPVVFGTASLVLGVFTLRQLRSGLRTSSRQRCLEFLSLCAVPGAVWLGLRLLAGARGLARWLTEWVFFPIGIVLHAIVSFFDSLTHLYEEPEPSPPPVTPSPELLEELPEEELAFTAPLPRPDETVGQKITLVLILIAAIAAVCFFIWFFRRLRETRKDVEPAEGAEIATQADPGGAELSREAERSINRRRLRRVYEKYLKLLRKRHFVRLPQDNSLDIVEKTRRISPEEDALALRSLYVPARYDPNALVTEAQVREARALLQKLRDAQKLP